MDFDRLSETDKTAVGEALRAAADGPFFPNWEFHAQFGLEREEVRAIADAWPTQAACQADVELAVNNSVNNLLGYPHHNEIVWSQWISVGRQQLNELLDRLRGRHDEHFLDRLK